jgi:hypothetical protein
VEGRSAGEDRRRRHRPGLDRLPAAADRGHILGPQWAVAWLDVILLGVFVVMALRWRRIWLIVACATQLLTAATHFTSILDPRLFALAIITAYYVWSYATLGALAWGTYEASRRQ